MKRKLQVFVSSTFTDLIEERQAAVSAILKAGHIPAGMELFTAADRSQMDIIKKWIDESDVYMLILGGRYGSIEPTSGKSYTELEYDYAVEQGKALFAVVIKDEALTRKVKEHGTDFIELNEPKYLAEFKRKVLSNMSSFFEDEKDIRLCVHESLSDFNANRKLKGWVSADDIVDTHDLAEEIKKLSEENRKLKKELDLKSKQAVSSKTPKVKELTEVLKKMEVVIPPSVSGKDNPIETNTLKLFLIYKNALIGGVTNAAGNGKITSFLYHNICPTLKIHGLMDNEKVTGAVRRYSVTKEGLQFLAELDRQVLKN